MTMHVCFPLAHIYGYNSIVTFSHEEQLHAKGEMEQIYCVMQPPIPPKAITPLHKMV